MTISFLSAPINLTRAADGSWNGIGQLSDGMDAIITLQRQEEDVATEEAATTKPTEVSATGTTPAP
jgi:hypothetical protein